MKNSNKHRSGFTLVEITLALLVIAVGVLAVFGLMGDALRANTNTLDDTVAATFAESVFSSIFAADWDVLKDDKRVPILMGQAFWNQPDNQKWIAVPTESPQSYKLRYKPQGADVAIDYHPITYDLKIEEQKDPRGNYVGGRNAAPHDDAVWRSLRLKVWIGEFADTNSVPRNFYTEQYRFINPKEEYENGGAQQD